MGIKIAQNCVSTQPWHKMFVLSRTTPGQVYEVQCPMPGDPPEEYICNCQGFTYRGHCKHQREVSVCGWEESVGPEQQTDEQRTNHTCPRCGNDTMEDWEME